MAVSNCFMFCCSLLYFHSSFAIILIGKRELVALILFFAFLVPCDCCVALSCGATGLSIVLIVVIPDHAHLLFLR